MKFGYRGHHGANLAFHSSRHFLQLHLSFSPRFARIAALKERTAMTAPLCTRSVTERVHRKRAQAYIQQLQQPPVTTDFPRPTDRVAQATVCFRAEQIKQRSISAHLPPPAPRTNCWPERSANA